MQLEQNEHDLLEKTKAKKRLFTAIVALWEVNKRRRAIFSAWQKRTQEKLKARRQAEYCQAFHL